MTHYTLIGIDPGLVHTGVVSIDLWPEAKQFEVDYSVVYGADIHGVIDALRGKQGPDTRLYVEGYRDRGTVNNMNSRMREFEGEIKRWLKSWSPKVMDNMGVKKIVTKPMMQAFGVWKLPHTNHQDLQSAARIALFGAIKDEEINPVIYQYLIDYREARPWQTP